jgi:acyl dehydratase
MGGAVMSESELPATWTRSFDIGDEETLRMFAESIGDTNPVHHDDRAARRLGFHGIIAPGVMILGFISSMIASEVPGVLVIHMDMAFLRPLYAKSSVLISCAVTQQWERDLYVEITIKNGLIEIARGSCVLRLPRSLR